MYTLSSYEQNTVCISCIRASIKHNLTRIVATKWQVNSVFGATQDLACLIRLNASVTNCLCATSLLLLGEKCSCDLKSSCVYRNWLESFDVFRIFCSHFKLLKKFYVFWALFFSNVVYLDAATRNIFLSVESVFENITKFFITEYVFLVPR